MHALVVLIPVLRRPHRVQPLLSSLHANTPDPVCALFICDSDDHAQQEAVKRCGADMLIHDGGYASKIDAAVAATSEPLVALMADDVVFHPRWLEHAKRYLKGGVHVVGLNDLRHRPREHATHFLLTRAYCQQPTLDGGQGPLHAGYRHNFPDRELIETARHRGAYAYARDSHVEHRHHLDGAAPHDETYEKGQATFRIDRRLFVERSRLWAA